MVQLLPAFARNKNFCNVDNAGIKKGFSVWKILVFEQSFISCQLATVNSTLLHLYVTLYLRKFVNKSPFSCLSIIDKEIL